ncbi:Cro/CI family transcriptional regulator [Marinobacterium lutimaris]|uniref:Cro/CI family transcriptional regulator n=1 Tax=Marinobacterium lutimaris TaxID=568106 RepID=UPI000CDE5797
MTKTEVLKHFGSQHELARQLTDAGYPISQPSISKWPEEIPELRARQLEEITGGALKRNSSESTFAA